MTKRIICIFSDLLKSPRTVGISGLEFWWTWRVTILNSDFSFVILECNSGVYKTLTEHDRSVSYTGVVKCDNTLAHNWYRITGAAGSQIPIFSVERKHCGTDAPGWMIGDQPTVAAGADPWFFLGGGALVSCSTSTPINHVVFFLQNTSCIRKPQVISGGVRTPFTLPLDPPLNAGHKLKRCYWLMYFLAGRDVNKEKSESETSKKATQLTQTLVICQRKNNFLRWLNKL